jgi:hypothetical protein
MSLWQIFKTFAGFNTMDPNGYTFLRSVSDRVCKDCTVLRGRLQTVYENGSQVNVGSGVYMHHAMFVDINKSRRLPISNCGDTLGNIPTFVGADAANRWQYYTTQDGLYGSGYYLKDNSMMLQAELINYRLVGEGVI